MRWHCFQHKYLNGFKIWPRVLLSERVWPDKVQSDYFWGTHYCAPEGLGGSFLHFRKSRPYLMEVLGFQALADQTFRSELWLDQFSILCLAPKRWIFWFWVVLHPTPRHEMKLDCRTSWRTDFLVPLITAIGPGPEEAKQVKTITLSLSRFIVNFFLVKCYAGFWISCNCRISHIFVTFVPRISPDLLVLMKILLSKCETILCVFFSLTVLGALPWMSFSPITFSKMWKWIPVCNEQVKRKHCVVCLLQRDQSLF